MNEIYRGYERWKGWSEEQFFKIDPKEAAYLKNELAPRALKGAALLEFGFGNATKLAWAAKQGAIVAGTEVNEQLCKRALTAGIKVLPPEFSFLKENYKSYFDFVIAYDVLEHLTMDEVVECIDTTSTILKPGGIFISRFPNGMSPLGRTLQYADRTHQSILSSAIISQLGIERSLQTINISDGEYFTIPRTLRDIIRYPKFLLRLFISEVSIWLFNLDTPIGSNIIVHMKKASDPL